jgi:hypothetical protein
MDGVAIGIHPEKNPAVPLAAIEKHLRAHSVEIGAEACDRPWAAPGGGPLWR